MRVAAAYPAAWAGYRTYELAAVPDLELLFLLCSYERMVHPRQFPPPWRVEEQEEAYVVTDGLGQRLAFVYFENESIRRGIVKRPTKDDAWRIARAITRISGLLRRD